MVGAYLRERFPLRLYVPLAGYLALSAGTPAGNLRTTAVDSAFALLLLAQFRTWDDLADRARDARTHPDRVLVQAKQVTSVIGFCGALAVLNLWLSVWRDGSGIAVAALAALDGALGTWYLARRADARPLAADYLLLVKYPAMLVVVAGGRVMAAPFRVAAMATLLYIVVCAYEAWHDPDSPLGRRYQGLGAKPSIGER